MLGFSILISHSRSKLQGTESNFVDVKTRLPAIKPRNKKKDGGGDFVPSASSSLPCSRLGHSPCRDLEPSPKSVRRASYEIHSFDQGPDPGVSRMAMEDGVKRV